MQTVCMKLRCRLCFSMKLECRLCALQRYNVFFSRLNTSQDVGSDGSPRLGESVSTYEQVYFFDFRRVVSSVKIFTNKFLFHLWSKISFIQFKLFFVEFSREKRECLISTPTK